MGTIKLSQVLLHQQVEQPTGSLTNQMDSVQPNGLLGGGFYLG